MANITDPFGKQVFGGMAGFTPGSVSTGGATTAAPKATPYKYAGQGWNDPLAQQMYMKYAFGGRLSPNILSQLSGPSQKAYEGSGNYHNPMDPKEWGGSVRGDDVEKMKAAYLAAGGQGTYDQLAATNPTSVGWPTDAAGNPLPRAGVTGKEYPQASGDWSSTLTSAGQPAGGSGSSFALAPEILSKMWK